MNIVSALAECRKNRTAIPAINFYNAEICIALIRAARTTGSHIILQVSPSTIRYLGLPITVGLARAAIDELDGKAWLHLDHCKDPALIEQCMKAGFDSVMIDASEEPFERNRDLSAQIVKLAKPFGIAVEAELGYVPKLGQELSDPEGQTSTDPEQAAEFVASTGVNSLAVAIGTAHGFYTKKPELDLDLLEKISDAVGVPLVLHGGSGLSDSQLRECIVRGISKVNFATEIKNAFSQTLRDCLSSGEIDMRSTFPPAIDKVTELVKSKIKTCTMKEILV